MTNSKNKSHYNVDFGRMELEYIKSLLKKERKDLEKEMVHYREQIEESSKMKEYDLLQVEIFDLWTRS